ncbi:hypothetical protein EJB05_25988, partial [Eragrostis curvula]
MANGDGDGGCSRSTQRCRVSGDCDGECERNLRCKVAAGDSTTGDDGESGDGNDDCYVDDDDDVYGGLDDEDMYDDDGGGGGGGDDMYYDSGDEKDLFKQTEEAEKKKKHDLLGKKEKKYTVLTEDDVRARQAADTATVADVLSVPAGIAAVLLRHFKWRADEAQERWFSDERRVRDAVGLPPPPEPVVAVAANAGDDAGLCAICFERHAAGRMRSAGCAAHFFCRACWRGYLRAAVEDGGARCLALRCPEPSCRAPVARELVEAAAPAADRARYAAFAVRSYVEDSGGRIKWWPAPGCTHAVELDSGEAGAAEPDVACSCGHSFCFRCGEEAHRPVTCETVRRWQAKNSSNAETANWVLANTKHCPRCRQPIEKNQGCNHMRCRCGHAFCWLCLGPAGKGNHYMCVGQPQHVRNVGGSKEEQKRRQAKASLDRYLYHYERWVANAKSLQMALADMEKLKESELEVMAAMVGAYSPKELDFFTEAYEQVADGRRVLRWSHAYGYFLDPERDAKKRELFDFVQNEANQALERLHGCAELERKEIYGYDDAEMGKKFMAYRNKLEKLTGVTRHYFENLVKAFESDLPEIFAVNFRDNK